MISDLVQKCHQRLANALEATIELPGGNATSIRNGATYELEPGDVIVIPAGVGYWFTKIDDHIRYLMIRIDPDKATPLKDEAASKVDLFSKER